MIESARESLQKLGEAVVSDEYARKQACSMVLEELRSVRREIGRKPVLMNLPDARSYAARILDDFIKQMERQRDRIT